MKSTSIESTRKKSILKILSSRPFSRGVSQMLAVQILRILNEFF